MFTIEEFEREFKPKLGGTIRWEGFSFIAKELAIQEPLAIIETGCIRSEHDWAGNGQATALWNWMSGKALTKRVMSVDISAENIRKCQNLCPNVTAIQCDSLLYLTQITAMPFVKSINLVYLDSYDHDNPKKPQSELHAAAELGCLYDNLSSGCLIAVDDCHPDGTGKHYLIKHFFQRLGIEPLVSSYIHVWRKP